MYGERLLHASYVTAAQGGHSFPVFMSPFRQLLIRRAVPVLWIQPMEEQRSELGAGQHSEEAAHRLMDAPRYGSTRI